MTTSQVARELGGHIFRWGLSCEDCTPEDFKIEMKKAIKQLDIALTQAISEKRERICRVVHEEFYHEIPEQQLLDAIRKL